MHNTAQKLRALFGVGLVTAASALTSACMDGNASQPIATSSGSSVKSQDGTGQTPSGGEAATPPATGPGAQTPSSRKINGDRQDPPEQTPSDQTTSTNSGDGTLPASQDQTQNQTPSVRASNGSGGRPGFDEVQFTSANKLRSSYKINAPQDAGPSKPYGLHIHLHGDGGGGYKDFPNRETRNDLIGVAVKAPNNDMTWGRQSGVQHAQFLQDLIQNELLKKYNINLDRIFFSGVSGGSYFLAGHFIPMYGYVYKSGAFLMCGGMNPQVRFEQPEFLKSFRIHWQITAAERQDILSSVRPAITAYQGQLRQVGGEQSWQTSEIAGRGGHCEFDGQDYTTGIQYMMDLKFSSIVR